MQSIAAPSESLQVANISEMAHEQALVQLFSAFEIVVAFSFLPSTRQVGLPSITDATASVASRADFPIDFPTVEIDGN